MFHNTTYAFVRLVFVASRKQWQRRQPSETEIGRRESSGMRPRRLGDGGDANLACSTCGAAWTAASLWLTRRTPAPLYRLRRLPPEGGRVILKSRYGPGSLALRSRGRVTIEGL